MYHTGFQIIQDPDVTYGRKNADFGQGFYVSSDKEFSKRWAKQRPNQSVYINQYELSLEQLSIKQLQKDEEWFQYLYQNRRGQKDIYAQYDVIIGPIANDTIFDTLGIFTSGFLSSEEVLRYLMVGPTYTQIVLKTKKATSFLQWLKADKLHEEEIHSLQEIHQKEEKEYQDELAQMMSLTEKEL